MYGRIDQVEAMGPRVDELDNIVRQIHSFAAMYRLDPIRTELDIACSMIVHHIANGRVTVDEIAECLTDGATVELAARQLQQLRFPEVG